MRECSASFYRELLLRSLDGAGIPEDEAAAQASRLTALFEALEKEDPQELFLGDASRVRQRELMHRLCIPGGDAPAAWVSAGLDWLAVGLADYFRRRSLENVTGSPDERFPRYFGPEPESAPLLPERPDAARVRAVLAAQEADPAYIAADARRRELFDPEAPVTPDVVYRQLRYVIEVFRVSIPRVENAAIRLADPELPGKIRECGRSVVREVAAKLIDRPGRNGEKAAYRYCACWYPAYYPLCSPAVSTALCALRDRLGFYPFLNRELADPEKFRRILLIFRSEYSLQTFDAYQCCRYLACVGAQLARGEDGEETPEENKKGSSI